MFAEIIGAISGNKKARMARDKMGEYAGYGREIMDKFSGYYTDAYESGNYKKLLEDPSQISRMPGYEFGLKESSRILSQRMGAAGCMRKGSSQRMLGQHVSDYASSKWAEYLQPYERQLGILQSGMQVAAGYGQTFGKLGALESGAYTDYANWKRQTGMMIGGGMDSFAKFFAGGGGGMGGLGG